jgi:hypothetical protein
MSQSSDKSILKKTNDPAPEWHSQQMLLLRNWAEVCSSYRWLHNQSYGYYKQRNLNFMIPIIVISTLTGTANFAQSSLPESFAAGAPAIIGVLNLFAALMTTVYQFLKVSELLEANRQASINFGKLSRNITVELNLPVKDRGNSGADFVKLCRSELDRLIEQSPYIEKRILAKYELQFGAKDIAKPEIICINKVEIFDDQESKIGNIVANAGSKFTELLNMSKAAKIKETMKKGQPDLTFSEKRKENINMELDILSKSKIVSNNSSLNLKKVSITGQDIDNKSWREAIDLLKPKTDSSLCIINMEPELEPEPENGVQERPRESFTSINVDETVDNIVNDIEIDYSVKL